MDEPVQKLIELGFTAMEAELYTFLLRESPATGYRMAQCLGKPLSNTYKAVESLQAKGAVLVEEGEPRSYRAIPAEELLGRLEREFLKRRAEAAHALAGISRETSDPGIYQLHSRSQVFERCRSMLQRCRQIVLIDLFPEPLEELRDLIESTAARGVLVGINVYRPAAVAGAEVVLDPHGETVLQRWPGQWLNLVIDGEECLLAFLQPGDAGLYQAIWSGSPYLSWLYHSAQTWALAGPALERMILEGVSLEQLQEHARSFRRFHAPEASGYQSLMKSFSPQPVVPSRPRRNRKGESN